MATNIDEIYQQHIKPLPREAQLRLLAKVAADLAASDEDSLKRSLLEGNSPENTKAEPAVHDPYTIPPAVTDPAERAALLREVVESMKSNPIPANAPRFTREELHERR